MAEAALKGAPVHTDAKKVARLLTREHQGRGVNISEICRRLGGPAHGASRSTIHALMNGTASPKVVTKLSPKILAEFERGESKETESMPANRSVLSTEAQSHFGLNGDPFRPQIRIEPYTNKALDQVHKRALNALRYQGFVSILGDPGSGKSTLRRRLMTDAGASNGKLRLLWPEFIDPTKVTPTSIVTYVLAQLNQAVPMNAMARQAKLVQHLADLAGDDVRVALAFDDCHTLPDHTLSALKRIWEWESGSFSGLLGLLLLGQPHFKHRLERVNFREIAARLDVVDMPEFRTKTGRATPAAWEYVTYRLGLVGGTAETLFEREAVDELAKANPTPLSLGNACNAALNRAFLAQEKKVTRLIAGAKDELTAIRLAG